MIKFDFSGQDTLTASPVTNDSIVTNSVGMKLKLIHAGSFMMGSTKGYDSEKPVHKVTLTRPSLVILSIPLAPVSLFRTKVALPAVVSIVMAEA